MPPRSFALWAALTVVCPLPALAEPAPAPAIAQPVWQAPLDLQDAVRRLAVAREQIARTGQVRLRYTEAQLRAQAESGVVPNSRYLVRLVYGDPRPTDPMGVVRPSGKLPLWVTTFDQLEPADSDPEAITRALGLPYDPRTTYSLLVFRDLGADEASRPPLISPTLPRLTELAAHDLVTPAFPEALLREALAPDYQPAYRALMATFYRRGFKEYINDDVEHFVSTESQLADPAARKRFLARLRVHVQYGASDLFRGDGVTLLMGDQARKAGVLELFCLDPAPKPVGQYEKAGQLVKVACKPLDKPRPLQFVGPEDDARP